MHDNVKIHTSHASTNWLILNRYRRIDHPPYSPDLNPIEHVWSLLKAGLHQHYPYIHEMGETEEDYQAFLDAIQDVWWNHIDQVIIDRLIESMPRRLEAVAANEGWYTRY